MSPQEIREVRNKLGLTQLQLAIKLDVEPSTISGWERGCHKPSPFRLKQLKSLMQN